MSFQNVITIEPDKRGGKPCIRRMRITVYDVLGWLASGMSQDEIIDDFPEPQEPYKPTVKTLFTSVLRIIFAKLSA